MILWNITDWEHSRNRFGLLRWFCFYFCFSAVTSQSTTFKVVHLKHSRLTVRYHSRYESALSVSTLSFSLPYTLVFGLPSLIDTLRIQSLSLSLQACFSPLCFLLFLSLTTFFAFECRREYYLPSGCLDFFEWKL